MGPRWQLCVVIHPQDSKYSSSWAVQPGLSRTVRVTDSGPNTVCEPGDVVYRENPFKGTEAARPWLVISNHEGRPFHGDQYVTLTLTTRTWHDGLLAIPAMETALSRRGTMVAR